MDTKHRADLMLDYLSGTLTTEKRQELENIVAGNHEYQKELDELKKTWENLDAQDTPEPSKKMDAKFYEMLANHSDKTSQKSSFSFNSIITFFTQNNNQWLYRFAMLVIGLSIGYAVNSNTSNTSTQVAQQDAQEVRESLVLALLEQPLANRRLQAFNETNKLKKVNKTIAKALLKTLNNDSNVNVRLAAIESLMLFSDDPFVREGLVKSIVHQDSPLVQVTIAKMMVAIQEKGASKEFNKLLEKEDLNSSVREELEKSVKSLI